MADVSAGLPPADGKDWPDNAQRFAALGWAGALLGQGLDPDWVPDVIHGHDWHAGLIPAYVRAFADAGRDTPATVFTLHNIAYQGLFPASLFPQLGLPATYFAVDGLEFYGQVSFMKAALHYADRIATVSPTYAREITAEPQGCGLDGVLRARHGVVRHSQRRRLPGLESGLGSVAADRLRSGHLVRQDQRQTGAAAAFRARVALEQSLVDAALQYPGQVGVQIGYDEGTAHALVAGADVMLVPSAFEPCGLTQLYGLRYGTLPLVRRVGGLADTVVDCTLENLDEGCATGFVFDELSADGLLSALRRAFALFRRPAQWVAVQRRGMGLRFDWPTAAQHYLAMYKSLRAGAKLRERVSNGR